MTDKTKIVGFFYPINLDKKGLEGGGINFLKELFSVFNKINKYNFKVNLYGISKKYKSLKDKNTFSISSNAGLIYGFSILKTSFDKNLKIAHINRYFHLIWLLPAKFIRKIKIVFTIHGNIPAMSIDRDTFIGSIKFKIIQFLFKDLFTRFFIDFIDTYVYVSDANKIYFSEQFLGFNKSQSKNHASHLVIKNPIKKISKPKDEIHDTKEIKSLINKFKLKDKFVCSILARLDPIKNHFKVFEAFLKNKDHCRQNNIVLVVVGSGALGKKLQAFIKKNNVEDIIHMIGARDHSELYYLLNEVNLNIILSISEGDPTVFYEFLSFEVPSLCSNVSNLWDIIDQYGLGIKCESVNPDFIFKKIRYEINFPTKLNKQYIKSILEKRTRFTQAKKYLSLYEDMM